MSLSSVGNGTTVNSKDVMDASCTAESEKILNQDSPAAVNLRLPSIFGATDEDTDSLRIVSLYEVSPNLASGHSLRWHCSACMISGLRPRFLVAQLYLVGIQVDLDNLEDQFDKGSS